MNKWIFREKIYMFHHVGSFVCFSFKVIIIINNFVYIPTNFVIVMIK